MSISNLTLSAIPGSTIEYVIFYSNRGNITASNVIIYDQLPGFILYKSNSATNLQAGWTNEYSTNSGTPDQSWISSDYTNIEPVSINVHWIRWRKSLLGTGASGTLNFKLIIQ